MSRSRVAVYVRVSTEEQREQGYSIDAQIDKLTKECEAKGFERVGIYNDEGYSGKDFNRPEIQRLIKDIQADLVDVVMVTKTDRISRSASRLLWFVDDILNLKNKRLLCIDNNVDSSTNEGKLYLSMLVSVAEFERGMILERVQDGMLERARQGNYNGGRILGYTAINKELVIEPEEAELVKKIFNYRSEGKGYKWIASRLNEHGYKGKNGKPFSINGVKTILQNVIYIGKISWGKYKNYATKGRSGKQEPHIFEGKHERIIEQELWDKVQALQDLKRNQVIHPSQFKGEFVLSGILRCPQCGGGTVMSKSKKRNGTGYHLYYKCQTYHSQGITACRTNLVKKEVVEAQVLEIIREMIVKPDLIRNIIQNEAGKDQSESAEISCILDMKQKELSKLTEKQDKLLESHLEGLIPKRVFERQIKEFEEKILSCETTILEYKDQLRKVQSQMVLSEDIVIQALTQFEELYHQATNKMKRNLLKALIKEIHVDRARKRIESIVFWFSEYNSFLPDGSTSDESRGTVP